MAFKGQMTGKNNPRYKHGHHCGYKSSPTYKTWCGMLSRCRNPNDRVYERYGGRGITVCKRWLVFENFLADMGDRPEGTSIDRINTYGNYTPKNCRWATPKEQSINHRKYKHPNSKKTHCRNGHPYRGKNLYIDNRGFRHCKECKRLRDRKTAMGEMQVLVGRDGGCR